jgi:hypothetical protein
MDLPLGSALRGEGGQSPRLVRGVDDLEAGQLAEAGVLARDFADANAVGQADRVAWVAHPHRRAR